MFYILNFSYTLHSASGIRLQAYYKSLDKLGVDTTVVNLFPDEAFSYCREEFKHVKFIYYWNRFIPYRGLFRKLTLKLYINKFLSCLQSDDIVYTYNISKLTQYCQNKDGVKVYAERTEHPLVNPGFPHPLLSLDEDALIETLIKLNGLFVISEPLKEYYTKLGLDKSKIEIINMIVDPSRFECIKKTPCKNRYVAYCGTASNNKDGVDELIKAFAIVAKQIPNISLYIIGKTPSKKQRFDNIELVKTLGIDDSVVFTGMVNAEKIPQLLKNAEVLVLDRPDNLQAKYGFPTKLGEYLLTENPVVVTSVGDIPKFLKDGISALIAKPQNADDFASKLIWVLSNKEKALRIGHNGYAVAMDCFNSFTETKKIVDKIFA